MRFVCSAALTLTMVASAGYSEDNTPPSEEFQLLFTGKDLRNWIADPVVLKHWVVKEGILHGNGLPIKDVELTPQEPAATAKIDRYQNLVSENSYRDFELQIDWRVQPGGSGGIWLRGRPKVDIPDPAKNEAGSGGLVNNKKAPSPPAVKADNPAGEWNTFHIQVVGNKVTVKLNDQVVVDNVVMENAFDSSRKLPFAGPIELEARGPIEFKNIYLRPIAK